MTTVIINNGSGYIKFGLNNQNVPTLRAPCLLTNNYENPHSQMPIRNGTVYDWDSLSSIWETLLSKHKIKPEEFKLLLTLPLPNFSKNKLYEILFEYFNFKSVYIGDPKCLTLYSSGRTTGLIYDCGHHLTQINPVYQGYHLDTQSKIINFGGRDLDDYLLNKITNSSHSSRKITYEELHKFKHQLNKQSTNKYQLPDGHTIMTSENDFSLSEILLKPSVIGKDIQNCGLQITDTIKSCDLNTRHDLQNNIILSGGTTLVSNFEHKLNLYLSSSLDRNVKVIHHPNQQYIEWMGGSIVSELSFFEDLSITRNDYLFDNKKNLYIQ